MQNIKDKVIVITGASSGLGAAAAKLLAGEGAKLVLGARRQDRLAALAKELGLEERAIVRTDVTKRAEVEALVKRAIELHGRIDVLMNNAGLMPSSPLDKLQVADWEQMIDTNIKGVLYGIAAALPLMEQQKSGHIINTASVAGLKVHAGGAVYAGTKFAVRAITEGLRQEAAPHNIRTTIISPGAVATELTHTITDKQTKTAMDQVYQGAISPDSFARAVAFAISQPAEVAVNEIVFRPAAQVF